MKVYTIRTGQLYQRGKFDRYSVVEKAALVKELKLDIVVNMTARYDPVMSELVHYINCPIPDSAKANFKLVEQALMPVVKRMRRGAAVLVHCNGGRNRSSLFSARLLMELEGMSGTEAVKELQWLRPNALATPAFVVYLRNL